LDPDRFELPNRTELLRSGSRSLSQRLPKRLGEHDGISAECVYRANPHTDSDANSYGNTEPNTYSDGYSYSDRNRDIHADGNRHVHAYTFSNGYVHAYTDGHSDVHSYSNSDCNSGNTDSDANMHTGRDLVRHFERFWHTGG
jgi:hypothetical protein